MIPSLVKQATELVMNGKYDTKTLIIIGLIGIIVIIYIRRFIFRIVNRLLRKIL